MEPVDTAEGWKPQAFLPQPQMAPNPTDIWLPCLEARDDRTTLCRLCQGLTISSLRAPDGHVHAPSRAALLASAATCRLCALIEREIFWARGDGSGPEMQFEGAVDRGFSTCGASGEAEEDEAARVDACAVRLAIVPDGWDKTPAQKATTTTTTPGNDARSAGFASIGIWLKSKHMLTDLHVVVEEGDPLGAPMSGPGGSGEGGCHVVGRTIVSPEVPHDALFDVVRGWLDTCTGSHSKCSADHDDAGPPVLPTRVLDVARDGQDPRLVVTGGGLRGRYVALSHCWGRSQPIKTELATLDRRRERVPMARLPKTFRDAVVITRRLGVRYLWIDSLCIVQDSVRDWNRESALMSSVYCSSTLTIAATGAADGTVGCFIPEAHNQIVALPSSFGGRGQAYATGSRMGSYGPGPSWSDEVCAGIFNKRAWALQEKSLSRRILHCCRGRWVWECCERVEAQYGYAEKRDNARTCHFQTKLGTMRRAFEGVYRLADDESESEDEDEDETNDIGCPREKDSVQTTKTGDSLQPEESISIAVSLTDPPNGRLTTPIDLRPDSGTNPLLEPVSLTRQAESDNELYDFLAVAARHTRHHTWYALVAEYTSRVLTNSADKLPALSGLAATVQAITRDTYLAGHWRAELERSLFWTTSVRPGAPMPRRCPQYRAPSWAWPSVDGIVEWSWPDLGRGVAGAAPIEIVGVDVGVVSRENPFGRVGGGRLVVRGNVMRAVWDEGMGGWVVGGREAARGGGAELERYDPDSSHKTSSHKPPKFLRADGDTVGCWACDDRLNALMPGPDLAGSGTATQQDSASRRVPWPSYGFRGTEPSTAAVYGRDYLESVERFSVLPQELVCLRGPTRRFIGEYEQSSNGDMEWRTDALVLAKAPGQEEFHRIGLGSFGSWGVGAGCTAPVEITII